MTKNIVAIGSLAFLVLAAACSTTVSTTPDDTFTVAAGCSPDTSLVCEGGSVGYSCDSGRPDDNEPSLNCSDGEGGGFCCIELTGTDCGQDDSVTCSGNSFGFTCASGDNPTSVDANLICSDPTAVGSADTFCCAAFAYDSGGNSCKADASVDSCDDSSYGFSCTGSDTPDGVDSTLNCSTGVDDPTTGATNFCCTQN